MVPPKPKAMTMPHVTSATGSSDTLQEPPAPSGVSKTSE